MEATQSAAAWWHRLPEVCRVVTVAAATEVVAEEWVVAAAAAVAVGMAGCLEVDQVVGWGWGWAHPLWAGLVRGADTVAGCWGGLLQRLVVHVGGHTRRMVGCRGLQEEVVVVWCLV
jgi:hypothetical protein